MYCSKCGKKNDEDAKFCHYCGENIKKSKKVAVKTELNNKGIEKFSNGETPKHLTVMYLTTFGFYSIIWLSNNWRYIKKYYRSDINVIFRTIGLFVPILNLFLVYSQFKDLRDFASREGVDTKIKPFWNMICFIVLNYCFLGFLQLNSIQKDINNIWKKVQPNLIIRKKLSTGEIVWISIMCTLLFLVIFDSF